MMPKTTDSHAWLLDSLSHL